MGPDTDFVSFKLIMKLLQVLLIIIMSYQALLHNKTKSQSQIPARGTWGYQLLFFMKLCLDVWNDRVQDDHLLPADLAALRHSGPGPGGGHPAGEA